MSEIGNWDIFLHTEGLEVENQERDIFKFEILFGVGGVDLFD